MVGFILRCGRPRPVQAAVVLLVLVAESLPAGGPPPTADFLFRKGRWEAARAAYDAALRNMPDRLSDDALRAARNAVVCSVELGAWADALARVRRLRWATDRLPPHPDARQETDEQLAAPRGIRQLEFVRELCALLDRRLPAGARERPALAGEWVGAGAALATQLVGEGFGTEYAWQQATAWWWGDGDGPDADADAGAWWGPDGRLHFRTAPARYVPTLGRVSKLLYLWDEITRFDPTPAGEHAARALLQRAVVCWTVYARDTDAWPGGDSEYQSSKRPVSGPEVADPKPAWALAEDEVRLVGAARDRIVRLPADQSPIALLRLLERKYPRSSAVPEAIYTQGLFFQRRQQFDRALAEYGRLLKTFPRDQQCLAARKQIDHIRHADVLLGSAGVAVVGSRPTVWFTFRNAHIVEFTARRFDLARYARDLVRAGWRWDLMLLDNAVRSLVTDGAGDEANPRLARYADGPPVRWTERVPAGDRVATRATHVPVTRPGGYLVEAGLPGGGPTSRTLVLLTDVAIVYKALADRSLLFVADARTGRALGRQPVHLVRNLPNQGPWAEALTTGPDGTIERKFGRNEQGCAIALTRDGGLGVAAFQAVQWPPDERIVCCHVMTDRPAYRPGSEVYFRIWVRRTDRRRFRPVPGPEVVHVLVKDPKDAVVKAFDLRTDAVGAVSGSVYLPADARLGAYRIEVTQTNHALYGGGSFAVEEYKKPEFEVTVRPMQAAARPGNRLRVRVEARYYFGGPVGNGYVHYQVARTDRRPAPPPQPFDWLYGPGYGRLGYHYPWLTHQPPDAWPATVLTGAGQAEEDPILHRMELLLTEGETPLNADGTAEVEIDTAPFEQPADGDRIYSVTAEVRDTGRRTVRGRCTVAVTRQRLAAQVELDRGWYGPRDEATVTVHLRDAQGVGVAADGTLRLLRVTYDGPDLAKVRQEVVAARAVRSDAQGRLTARLPLGAEGEYRVEFETRDAAGARVTADAAVWVHGPAFDGKRYRFQPLEVIPDRPTYRVGDTAHVLVHTAHADASVIFSDNLERFTRSYRVLAMSNHARVIDIRIEPRHVPNFVVEATAVADGRVLTEACDLLVPPVADLLTVQIRTDRTEYEPGRPGLARVVVRDAAGRPVSGPVAFTAYDKAVSAFADRPEAAARSLLQYTRAPYSYIVTSSFDTFQHESSGQLVCPEYEIYSHVARWYGGAGGVGGLGGGLGGAAGLGGGGRPVRGSRDMDQEMAGDAGGRRGPAVHFVSRPPVRLVQPDVRHRFGDTAVWQPTLELDKNGTAEVPIPFPDSATTWRLRAQILTAATQVGDATAEVRTVKRLLVRLQTPRFLVEGDEVVLTANVQNDLPTDKDVTAELLLSAAVLQPAGAAPAADAAGNRRLVARARVKAGGTHRFDWPVRALKPGAAALTVRALTDQESDAVRLTLPVLANVLPLVEAHAGFLRSGEAAPRSVTLTVPGGTDPAQTRLEIALAPGTAGVMADALPFLIGYPYGCTEQTMSRFYPTILAAGALKRLGTDLAALARRGHRAGPGGVFDTGVMRHMARAGLRRLAGFQHHDGGWGWWADDPSSPPMTAYVLAGLNAAAQAGFELDDLDYRRGFDYLLAAARGPEPAGHAAPFGRVAESAYVAYVLALPLPRVGDAAPSADAGRASRARQYREAVLADRQRLNAYGLALLALAFHHGNQPDQARPLLHEALAGVVCDEARETAGIRPPRDWSGDWWDSDIEANAWLLRAAAAIEPANDLVPLLARGLVARRYGGEHWRSTRDTALAVAALAEYLVPRRPGDHAGRVVLTLDGKPLGAVALQPGKDLTLSQRLAVEGTRLPPGRHTLTLTKAGPAEVNFACTLRYVLRADAVRPAGKGLTLERRYYRVTGPNRSPVGADRVPLADGDRVAVGTVIEAELSVAADAACHYLAFEDPKPAGCEPVEIQSGRLGDDAGWATGELRDDRVLFYVDYLPAGRRTFRYRLRAEAPGTFHALPPRGFAMYAPDEVYARGSAFRLRVGE